METTEKLLTIKEVAEYVRVPLRYVQAAVRNREIEYIDLGTVKGGPHTRLKRFTQTAIKRWLESLSQHKEPQIL